MRGVSACAKGIKQRAGLFSMETLSSYKDVKETKTIGYSYY